MLKAIAKKIQPIWAFKDRNRSLKHQLIRGVAGSFSIKIAASGFAFMLSVILARFLGTTGLGTYSYAVTWANLLSIPATLGIDRLIVREMAIYRAKSRWGLMNGLLRWSNLMVLGFSSILTISAIAVPWLLIPQWGINGAAAATTTSLIVINILKVVFVRKKLNISLYLWHTK
ncbi:oligosaccharide flippase family protein [Pleurocapsales cyanobacterium LEGE 10410]|nr:oligosaccharide flippase family protein [Pleurocapsales cyanobacterium LEGE 10410]